MITPPGTPPQRRGTQFSNNPTIGVGATTIVAAGANPNGLIVRTATMISGGASSLDIRDGTVIMLACGPGQVVSYLGPGLLIPPGAPFAIQSSAAGASAFLSWDLL